MKQQARADQRWGGSFAIGDQQETERRYVNVSEAEIRLQKETAIHEAGHAVIGILNGRRFEMVTIERRMGALGSCDFTSERRMGALGSCDFTSLDWLEFVVQERPDRLAEARQLICVAMVVVAAGFAAEKRLGSFDADEYTDSNDLAQLRSMAAFVHSSAHQQQWLIADVWNRADQFLNSDRLWLKVSLVANELLRKNTLTFDEVVALAGMPFSDRFAEANFLAEAPGSTMADGHD